MQNVGAQLFVSKWEKNTRLNMKAIDQTQKYFDCELTNH